MTGLLGLVAIQVSRPVFEGIGPLGKAIFYSIAAASTAVFGWGVWHRMRKYQMGRTTGRGATLRTSLAGRLRSIGKGATVAKGHRGAGVAHFFILWGFLAAFLATVILTIDTDVVRNVSRLFAGHDDSVFHGTFFIVYTFVIDTMGFALTCLFALYGGASRRPPST